jgi:hypothetical protein
MARTVVCHSVVRGPLGGGAESSEEFSAVDICALNLFERKFTNKFYTVPYCYIFSRKRTVLNAKHMLMYHHTQYLRII